MSLSKEQLTVAEAEQPRRPKCSRCRHHGIIVPQKGHMKYCPFLKCDCWKCYLITQRTRITALQRNLKKAQSNEQRPGCAQPGVAAVKPAAAGTCGASAPEGGARPSATSGPMCPPPGGAPERAAAAAATATTTAAWSPLDLRSRAAAGGESVAGLDSRNMLPFASSEEGSCSSLNAPYFGEFGQTPPLPFIHFPFRMSGHFPGSYAPYPNYLLNVPWLPPVPAGLYSDGLCGPLMFPPFQSGAVPYLPPPEPGSPTVFFPPPPLPEAVQEEPIN